MGDVEKIRKQLYLHTLEDFYQIPFTYLQIVEGIRNKRGKYPFFFSSSNFSIHLFYATRYKSVEELAQVAYPAHPWDHEK